MLSSNQDSSTPSPSDSSANTSCWRKIWTMNIPNKIKHFLWRACRESLPTKKNLLVRNVTRNATCEWCNEEVEDTVHALWGCQVLKEVWWEEEVLRNQLSMRFVDFRDLWTGVTNLDVANLADRFAMVTWGIWNKRNATRMQVPSLPFHQLYQNMQERLTEFRLAQEQPVSEPRPSDTPRWFPPQNSQHKVNYDGALFKETWQAGVGAVVRDVDGRVCGAISDRIALPGSVEEVEAIACRTAVRFALQLGLAEVVFEGDSETITAAINSSSQCFSSYGHILDEVRTMALNFVSVAFVHVKRQGNGVADKLAKASKAIQCPHVWTNDIPSDVQQHVILDSCFD